MQNDKLLPDSLESPPRVLAIDSIRAGDFLPVLSDKEPYPMNGVPCPQKKLHLPKVHYQKRTEGLTTKQRQPRYNYRSELRSFWQIE
jgi:hypothetical protein